MPLIMLNMSHSAFLVAITYAVAILPFIVITPFAGVIGDRYNHKKLMILLECLSIVIVIIASQIIFTHKNIYLFLFLTFLVSSISASHHPIFQTMISSVVAKDKIKYFMSYIGVSDNLITFLALAIIGLLMVFLTTKSILELVVVGYTLSLIFLFFINYKNDLTLNNDKKSVLGSLKEGFTYVYNNKIILHLCILFFVANLGIRLIYTNLIYHFNVDFNVSNNTIGYLFAVIGIGSVAGSLIAPRIIGKSGNLIIVLWSTILTGVISLFMCIAHTSVLSSIIWSISSAFQAIIIVTFFTLRQKIVPKEIIGRVVGVTRLIAYMSIPLSAITGGAIMKYTNSFSLVAFIGAIIIIFIGVAYFKLFYKLQKDEISE